MKENHKNILIIIALLIVSCFFYITIRDNQILKQQNEQFLNDKSFYQKELDKINIISSNTLLECQKNQKYLDIIAKNQEIIAKQLQIDQIIIDNK